MWHDWLEGGAAFLLAFLIGTLVEYSVHRLMHGKMVLGKKHAEHHRDGWGQGWLGEFGDYFLPCLPVMWLGFLYSIGAGIGWALGGFVYAALAAYAHQLQHENPDMVFWMPRPVHHLHHKHHMWRHNFGILVDWWDRVFGTYQYVEWQRGKPMLKHGLGALFRITWLYRKEEQPTEAATSIRE
jgi:sterol desaturase/sphingolipid hydroxylase (fatty acid hydroxylase superfamily)